MALSTNLETEFGQGDFDLAGTFAGLTSQLEEIEVPAVALDGAALTAAAGRLDSIDTSTIGDAVGLLVEELEALGLDLPILGDLVAPLTAVLNAGDQLTSVDLAASRDAIVGRTIDFDAVGADSIAARLGSLEGVFDAEPVGAITSVVAPLIPGGFDLDAVLEALTGDIRGVEVLIRALGALMAVQTTVREIVAGTRFVLGSMDPGVLSEISLRLGGWVDRDVAGLFEGIDPADPQLVELVGGPVLAMTADVRVAAEALTLGVDFGRSALAEVDVLALAGRLEAASAVLTEEGLDAVRALAERIVTLLRPILTMELPDTGDSTEALGEAIRAKLAPVAAAIDALDPAALTSGLTAGFSQALSFVDALARAAEDVVVAARSAFEAVRLALAAIDLAPITDAIRSALEPVSAVIDEITELVTGAQQTIEDAGGSVVGVMETVGAAFADATEAIAEAFDRVDAVVEALDLGNLQANIESAIEPISSAVASLQLLPVFDTAVDAIDTTADVVAAVPLGLLPDDALGELAEAVQPIRAIDFQVDVADVLKARLDDIVGSLDTDILSAIEDAYEAVVAFLESIDPAGPLEEVEAQVFDPLLEELRAINPAEILAPLQQSLDPIQDAIGTLDLGDDLLGPIETVIDNLAAKLNEFDPALMLGSIQERVDAARTSMTELLRIDEIRGHLDTVEELVTTWLDGFDFDALVAALDAMYPPFTEQLLTPSGDADVLGTLAAGLMRKTGLSVGTPALNAVGAWIGGEPAGPITQSLLSDAADGIETLHAAAESFDLAEIVGRLQPRYRSLQIAVEGLPAESPLRLAIEADVAAASPLEQLGPFVDAVTEYRAELASAGTELRSLAGSERSGLDAVAAGLRDALRPLTAIADWVRSIASRFGLDPASTLREVLNDLAASMTPSRVLADVFDAIKGLIARVQALATTGVLSPIREAINDVEAALAAIDIGFIVDELDAAHGELISVLDGVRPSLILGDVMADFEALQAALAEFDPLGPVRTAAEAMIDAVESGAEQLRPTTVFEPVIATYARIVDALGALDVRMLLEPLLEAIERITLELGTGLDLTASALGRLQAALPDPDSIQSGASASADVSVGIG